MKNLLIVLCLAVLAVNAYADGNRGGAKGGPGGGKNGRGDPAQHMQRMQERFGVSDDQAAQMREIRENGGSRKDIRAVLTDEQREAMAEARHSRAEHQGGNRRGGEDNQGGFETQ